MTRYPKSGRGRKWTVVELRAIPTTWNGDQLSDGQGLTGDVRVSKAGVVSVRFRVAFRCDGKIAHHNCGTWPTWSMEEIRAARERARVVLHSGVSPKVAAQAERLELQAKVARTLAEAERAREDGKTFSEMFETWFEDGVRRHDGNVELRRTFAKDLIPHLGSVPVRLVTEKMICDALRRVVKRGANRPTVRLYKDLRQLFGWAEQRQPWRRLLQEGNPVKLIDIRRLLPADYDINNERSRVLSVNEIRELHDKFAAMRTEWAQAPDRRSASKPMKRQTELALWICLSTTCRIGELVRSEWSHVDMAAGTWVIPADNVKRTRAKPQGQLVQMSAFTLRLFSELQGLTGRSRWCFPASLVDDKHLNESTIGKQVSDRQVEFMDRKPIKGRCHDSALVLSGGRNGNWTPHDLRRTAATMMQALGVLPHVIDRCQNHVMDGSRVRRHYLRYDYASEKADAWHRLGERLAQIVAGGKVVAFTPRAA